MYERYFNPQVNEFLSKAKSGDNLVAILKFGCKTLRIETEAVCNGIIPLFKDMLFAVISQSPLSPHDICSIVFNNECGELTEKSNWTVATSGVPKPPVKPVSSPTCDRPNLRSPRPCVAKRCVYVLHAGIVSTFIYTMT